MKLISRLPLILLIITLFIVVGCKVKRPSEVIPESTMENLLYDYHIAKALGENVPYNENYKKSLYIEAVFDKYGVTEAEFDSSMVWYTRNVETLSKIYEKINAKAKTRQTDIDRLIALRDKKPMTSLSGDSVDVWAWRKAIRLYNTPVYMNYSFVLPVDSNFKKNDIFEWTAQYEYLNGLPDTALMATISMQILYANDSVTGITKKVYSTGYDTIRLYTDTLSDVKEVRGFIYYPNSTEKSLLLIDSIALMRYRGSDSLNIDSLNLIQRQSAIIDSLSADTSVQQLNVPAEAQQVLRNTPENMNRPRSSADQIERVEMKEVEDHIELERKELERQRRNSQRQQIRQTPR